jgi:hypothetical protein
VAGTASGLCPVAVRGISCGTKELIAPYNSTEQFGYTKHSSTVNT